MFQLTHFSPLAEDKYGPELPGRYFLFLGIIFAIIAYSSNHYWDEFYYLYSVNAFPLNQLLQMEPDLGTGMFPQGFFSVKIAFVVFLYFLDSLLPGGMASLYMVQSIFTCIVLLFVASSYLLITELLTKRKAIWISVILLFMPLSIYFGYKVLSEIFSLFWIVLACWVYLKALQQKRFERATFLYFFCVILLLIGVLSRFTSIIFFGGMVVSLFLLGDQRFSRTRLFLSAFLVTSALVAATLLNYRFVVGLSFAEINALLGAVTVRSHGVAIKIYSIFMVMQLFALPIIASIKRFYSFDMAFATCWLLTCSLPFVFLSEYVEPRYFYMAMVPLAIISCNGIMVLVSFFRRESKAYKSLSIYILLGFILLGNRFFFADLMTYELKQANYFQLIAKLEEKSSSPSFIVPWISDFCLLKYVYPEKNIHLAWSMPYGQEYPFFSVPAYIQWAGGDKYIDSIEKLQKLPQPIYYIGWRFNPPVIEIKRRMLWLKNRYVDTVEINEGLKNHLAQSWIWEHPDIELKPALQVPPYESFLVETTPR